MIKFSSPTAIGTEAKYLNQVIKDGHLAGDGTFCKRCRGQLESILSAQNVMLTSSCTHALEMCALILNIDHNSEIICPSFSFPTSAGAFTQYGAKINFVDIRPDTLNIDENKIVSAITDKTKAIVVVHYAGVACEMDEIMKIANEHNLIVIEDAAQALSCKYKGQSLGTIGDFGCFSFHATKNYTSGEGGAFIANNKDFIANAEMIREKGTNRSSFLRSEINKYSWITNGSSYLMSELNAAYLHAQLEQINLINEKRKSLWNLYFDQFKGSNLLRKLEIPQIPEHCEHNSHIFYVKTESEQEREELKDHLAANKIQATTHFVPLHSSPAGIKYGRFIGNDEFTTKESSRILRLPLHHNLTLDQVSYVFEQIKKFFT